MKRRLYLIACLFGIHHWDHWIHTRSCTHCHTTQYRNHNRWSAIYSSNHRSNTHTEVNHGRII